jgi:hypothetical protein
MTFGKEIFKSLCLGKDARTDGYDRLTTLAYLTVNSIEEIPERLKSGRTV